MSTPLTAVVAGHLCLDIFPSLKRLPVGGFEALLKPGRLVEVGPPAFSTGGAVPNTGLVLHQLGVETHLMGKIGADLFGDAVLKLLDRWHPGLSEGIVRDINTSTSYSIIISYPGVDRVFLHYPGANDTFTSQDIDYDRVAAVRLFHFGYPPVMHRMYQARGEELLRLFRRAKETGVTTSLDMAFPDPSSEGSRVNWRAILQAILPFVDLFLPSIEELLLMLQPETYQRLLSQAGKEPLLKQITPQLLTSLGAELLRMGATIVMIKLGENGVYLRTAGHRILESLGRARPVDLDPWSNRELWSPCFRVKVVGTTGAGDSTIAGFLSAFLRGLPPLEALNAAVAVGACNVEAADAISGVPPWPEIQRRIQAGWERRSLNLDFPGWRWQPESEIWSGPDDSKELG